jgi:hypothetical protein
MLVTLVAVCLFYIDPDDEHQDLFDVFKTDVGDNIYF